jgi:hypothetical protein
LLPLGAAGLTFILPITVAIVILLAIVYVSYRQTIAAYPNGGRVLYGCARKPWHERQSSGRRRFDDGLRVECRGRNLGWHRRVDLGGARCRYP